MLFAIFIQDFGLINRTIIFITATVITINAIISIGVIIFFTSFYFLFLLDLHPCALALIKIIAAATVIITLDQVACETQTSTIINIAINPPQTWELYSGEHATSFFFAIFNLREGII